MRRSTAHSSSSRAHREHRLRHAGLPGDFRARLRLSSTAIGAAVAAMCSQRCDEPGSISFTLNDQFIAGPACDLEGFLAVHGVERENAVVQPWRRSAPARRGSHRLLVDPSCARMIRWSTAKALSTCAALRSAKASKLCRNVFPSMAMKRDGAAAQETSRLSA